MHTVSIKNDFLSILTLLIKTPSVVGCERVFLNLLQKECQALDLTTTLYEGILEVSGGAALIEDEVVLSAHVDRHGLICTGPNEFQYAAFSAKYGSNLDGTSISEKILSAIEKRFISHSVIAYDPWTGLFLGQSNITNAYMCPHQNNLIFTIDPIEGITPGIPLGYNDDLEIEGDFISAQLDNVLSIAMILLLYKRGFRGRTLFTCEEEAGNSWRYLHSYFRRKNTKTKNLLVLDTSPFDLRSELESVDIVLRNRDVTETFNSFFTSKISSICMREDISFVKKDEYIKDPSSIGRTELGRIIHGSNGEISGTTIQFPTTDYHTDRETFFLPSIEKGVTVLERLLKA